MPGPRPKESRERVPEEPPATQLRIKKQGDDSAEPGEPGETQVESYSREEPEMSLSESQETQYEPRSKGDRLF